MDVVETTNFDDLIGGTALVQENGVTVTRWKPGPVGAFLMHGTGVIAINEIVRQPKAATLLQSIMEDRELPIRTPDGGMVKVPIGDGIIVAMTGNPGSDRDPDRPGAAAFTRTIPIRMEDGSTEERARRAEIAYLKRTGGKGASEPKAKTRADITSRDYTIKNEPLHKDELNAAVGFLDELEQLIEARQVQARTGGGAAGNSRATRLRPLYCARQRHGQLARGARHAQTVLLARPGTVCGGMEIGERRL